MKARATTLLSLVGVLVAGSAAALVNAQVLQPSATRPAAAPTVLDPGVGADVTLSTLPQQSLAPQPATQAVYQIATAGAVTIDTSGDVLTIVEVVPYGDWIVLGVTSNVGRVDVVLQQGTTVVEFNASLVGGIVNTGFVVSQVDTEEPDSDDHQPATTVARRPGGSAGGSTGGTTTTSVHDSDDDHDDEPDDDD